MRRMIHAPPPDLAHIGLEPPGDGTLPFHSSTDFWVGPKEGLGLTRPYQNSGPKRQVSRAL